MKKRFDRRSSPSSAFDWLELRRGRARRRPRNFVFERLENREMLSASVPTDPLFLQQWHLLNTGQEVGIPVFQDVLATPGEDINVLPAWNLGYTGAGVNVAVIDTGIDVNHPDLLANIHPFLSFDLIDGDLDASPDLLASANNARGIAVAGLIAADDNGLGSVGVAPGASLVPVRLFTFDDTGTQVTPTEQQLLDMLLLAGEDIDIFNHSWEMITQRETTGLSQDLEDALLNSVIFGRDGLGTIHVKSAGNDAGPPFSAGFSDIGNTDQANYSGWANSRFVIAVTGADHDGGYNNIDGTVTAFPESGANVLVAAPTGSFRAIDVIDDQGLGSGIWTTDALGEDGFNRAPLPSGFELDRDFLPDTDYTSRFNGNEAATAMVSGVIALMLEANPNLSWRDVQEILVRSARQNAQFENPTSGFNRGEWPNTWIVNRDEIFREPDNPIPPGMFGAPVTGMVFNPRTDANALDAGIGAFGATPDLFTNGAGYTVSQGRGEFGEQIGFGHGVVDAELAVRMAELWTTTGQTLADEATFTTFSTLSFQIKAAETVGGNLNFQYVIPGRFGSIGDPQGFGAFYDIYFADEPDFTTYTGPRSNGTFVDLEIPDANAMRMEWAEVKLDLTGEPNGLDRLRVTLVSPDGTHSELNTHFHAANGAQDFQPFLGEGRDMTNRVFFEPPGTIDPDGGNFTWTFSTNRHWGERFDASPEINPTTGEPYPNGQERGWQLHFENYSPGAFGIGGMEIAFHGTEIDPESKRIQGFVGVDDDRDTTFNFDRYTQSHSDLDGDLVINRYGEISRDAYLDQESFAENVLVTLSRTDTGEVVDQFLTGHDGNFYFDAVPDFYTVTVEDPLGRTVMDDPNVPADFLPKYKSEWQITPDYFVAWDHDRVPAVLSDFDPREDYDIPVDVNGDPLPWVDPFTASVVESGVKGINFLIDPGPAIAPEVLITGSIYADLLGNGVFDGQDRFQTGIDVYADLDRDGVFDIDTETSAKSLEDGSYSLTVPTEFLNSFQIRVIPPTGWVVTAPEGDFHNVLGGPGDTVGEFDFGLQPPAELRQFDVSGFVFGDLNGNGIMDGFDSGQLGVQVYADLNGNGELDAANEPSTTTAADGTYNLTVLSFDTINFDVRVNIGEGGTVTAPPSGVVNLTAGPGDSFADVDFGVQLPPAAAGRIFGSVFQDRNGNGQRDAVDFGADGFRVFIDLNRDGSFTNGEPSTFSGVGGIYALNDVTPGNVVVRIEIPASWTRTAPAAGFYEFALPEGGVVGNISFGVQNTSPSDFGDLQGYPTTLAENGPRHPIVQDFTTGAVYALGASVDGEPNGQPTANADGDDTTGINDDDGVRLVTAGGSLTDGLGRPAIIQPGVNFVRVSVQGVGGQLNAWMDFDGDGTFTGPGEQIFTNVDLNHNTTTDLAFNVPTVPANGGPVAARFRWGEAGLSFVGASLFGGEVEDYLFQTTHPVPVIPGDYDGNRVVDADDRLVWVDTFGSTTDLRADGNGNGIVDLADYTTWKDNEGMSVPAVGSGLGLEPEAIATGDAATSSFASTSYDATPDSQPTFRQTPTAWPALNMDARLLAHLESRSGEILAGEVALGDSLSFGSLLALASVQQQTDEPTLAFDEVPEDGDALADALLLDVAHAEEDDLPEDDFGMPGSDEADGDQDDLALTMAFDELANWHTGGWGV